MNSCCNDPIIRYKSVNSKNLVILIFIIIYKSGSESARTVRRNNKITQHDLFEVNFHLVFHSLLFFYIMGDDASLARGSVLCTVSHYRWILDLFVALHHDQPFHFRPQYYYAFGATIIITNSGKNCVYISECANL